ncbi:pilus motility taxis protein HmpF [[Limnothrix rosea] IAM M-220]|uniref:pilus motility taxis protein HmpF n=1 Tax=[Limnothrix rosea] IAM M-220 TaxID=454133 RepID=UPI00096968D7|nr:pilus motility taxis protein HmpF [[Limnothrix rosea] IAM M-220]OKH19571.1 hypothetical protein NIES208_01855 [[Limnothrix rosea] IAM M-220]
MLYLAEVKKTKGFMGVKTEVKLLACERNDKSWSAVPADEAIAADDLSQFGDGALVVVNLGGNRQIQGTPEPAGNRILSILQNFSRLLEKTKAQEEEIEQWKQSLTYQAEELNRRQAEMENRLEELEGAEEELERLAAQRDEVEKLKAESDALKAEFDRKQAELEGAWEHLRGEQARLEELQNESNGSSNGGGSLAPEQTERLKAIFEQIQGAIAPTDNFQERLANVLEASEQQQQQLKTGWDRLEEDRSQYQKLESDVQAIATELDQQEGILNEKTSALEAAKRQVQVQQELLQSKQQYLQFLTLALQNHEELSTSISGLAAGLGDSETEIVDVETLESMPLGELESTVNNLKGELDKLVNFVNDQEEELTLQHDAVKELREKIEATDPSDVMAYQELEEELKDEQERMGMLNETLVGQRRTLRDRQSVMRQHLQVLKRRQGVIEVEVETNINLNPVLARIQDEQQEYAEKRQKLTEILEQMNQSVQQTKDVLSTQESEVKQEKERFEQLQTEYKQKQLNYERLKVKVELYEAYLQPLQDNLDHINQPLRELEQLTHQFSSTTEQQQNLANELKSTLDPLMN